MVALRPATGDCQATNGVLGPPKIQSVSDLRTNLMPPTTPPATWLAPKDSCALVASIDTSWNTSPWAQATFIHKKKEKEEKRNGREKWKK
jgi:hypothetical protein